MKRTYRKRKVQKEVKLMGNLDRNVANRGRLMNLKKS